MNPWAQPLALHGIARNARLPHAWPGRESDRGRVGQTAPEVPVVRPAEQRIQDPRRGLGTCTTWSELLRPDNKRNRTHRKEHDVKKMITANRKLAIASAAALIAILCALAVAVAGNLGQTVTLVDPPAMTLTYEVYGPGDKRWRPNHPSLQRDQNARIPRQERLA